MKRHYINGFLLTGLLMLLIACTEKEKPLSAETDSAPVFDTRTPLGAKQQEMFDKYGVIFEYKWNRFAYAPNVVADPANMEDVLPYMELMEELFFKAMDSVSGPAFTAVKETPVRILLIGNGLNYGGAESFGESTSGQAGNIQPNRLTLGGLSPFGQVIRAKGPGADEAYFRAIYDAAPSSSPGDAGLIGFIYHEYTHYLDSKHQIPKGFEKPSKTEYLRGSDQYKRISLPSAVSKGYFIPYGMQNEHEDFATYVQTIIWKTDEEMQNEYLTNDTTRTKYQLVTKYFAELGIPVTALRDYLDRPSVKARLLALKRKYE